MRRVTRPREVTQWLLPLPFPAHILLGPSKKTLGQGVLARSMASTLRAIDMITKAKTGLVFPRRCNDTCFGSEYRIYIMFLGITINFSVPIIFLSSKPFLESQIANTIYNPYPNGGQSGVWLKCTLSTFVTPLCVISTIPRDIPLRSRCLDVLLLIVSSHNPSNSELSPSVYETI